MMKRISSWFDDGTRQCDICNGWKVPEEFTDFDYKFNSKRWADMHVCDKCNEAIELIRRGFFPQSL